MKDFGYYAGCFGALHTAVKLGRPAPHKALLLLAVIDLVEKGVIRENRIVPSEGLAEAFYDNAKRFYASSAVFVVACLVCRSEPRHYGGYGGGRPPGRAVGRYRAQGCSF
ncbi:MAG: hypothetical protein ACI4AM_06285 [Muribaculaceae bacterium]